MNQIQLNGAPHPLPAPCTVAELLSTLKLDPRVVAVERNLDIVPRADYGAVLVSPGDQLEIVTFVGGG